MESKDQALPKIQNDENIDLSLRSNGKNYIDQRKHAEMILHRIENNSSGVIGVAGVRGAGKSSLAQNVLNNCADKGHFTIMIPSPTAYDSKEFLLTVYQNICEEVKNDLDERIFNNDRDLNELGCDEYEKIDRRRKVFLYTVTALLLAICGYITIQFLANMQISLVNTSIATVEARIDSLTWEKETLVRRAER